MHFFSNFSFQNDKFMLKKAPNGDCMKHKMDGEAMYKQVDGGYKAGDSIYSNRAERDSIRFEKEEVRSLNHYHLHHDKIDRIDSFPESMAEVT